MGLPDYQEIMLPVLKFLSDNQEHSYREVVDNISAKYNLNEEERRKPLPSGQQPIIDNRVGWARVYMIKAGLLESTRRGYMKITQRGLEVLAKPPNKINIKFLEQFPEFVEFRTVRKEHSRESDNESLNQEADKNIEKKTPDELMESGFKEWNDKLKDDLLSEVRKNTPQFFEKLVLDLLNKMEYGDGKVTGRSGDGGVDGILNQDKLGIDKIYFQAKRYSENASVPISMLRDFIGTLQMNGKDKGIFITSSRFPKDAEEKVSTSHKSIVLIDGPKLVELMIKFGVGVSPAKKLYEIKEIDSDYFSED